MQTEYMNRMKSYYKNWNSEYINNGKQKNFDIKFDAETTVPIADIQAMIDHFLCARISEIFN